MNSEAEIKSRIADIFPTETPKMEERKQQQGCKCASSFVTYINGTLFCSNCSKSWTRGNRNEVWIDLDTASAKLLDKLDSQVDKTGESLNDFYEKHRLSQSRRDMLERIKLGLGLLVEEEDIDG